MVGTFLPGKYLQQFGIAWPGGNMDPGSNAGWPDNAVWPGNENQWNENSRKIKTKRLFRKK